MEIDNSAANAFRECPTLYFNSFCKEETGLDLIPYEDGEPRPLEVGDRGHQVFEEHYKGVELYPPYPNEAVENEVQVILAAYKNHYPVENFKLLDVERTIKVALPPMCPQCYGTQFWVAPSGLKLCEACDFSEMSEHIYTGKMDLVTVTPEGKLEIIDHKFEKRSAKSNLPQKWAARDQATLYVWAASKIYGFKPEDINFTVNVIRRPSPKGQVAAEFPPRQRLERTEKQIRKAVRDISIIACDIERYHIIFEEGDWPDNREHCLTWGQCTFYLPCTYGWSESIRKEKYEAKKPYLHLGGVPIIQ